MVDAVELKKEIDTNANEKIEIKEMEEFLKSEDNLKRLGEALKGNIDGELEKEFWKAICKVCEQIATKKVFIFFRKEKGIKGITLEEYDVLCFFVTNFGLKPKDKEYDKISDLQNKIYEILFHWHTNYINTYSKYLDGLSKAKDKEEYKRKHYADLGPYPALNERFHRQMQEKLAKFIQEHPIEHLSMREIGMEKEQIQRDDDVHKTEEILNKPGVIGGEDIETLEYFRSFYYRYVLRGEYKNPNIKLSDKSFQAFFPDSEKCTELLKRIDHKLECNEILKKLEEEIEEHLADPVASLEKLGIGTKNGKIVQRKNLEKDVQKKEDIDKITVENIKEYINIPSSVPQEYLEYITYNFKTIFSIHIQLHPGWKPMIGDPEAKLPQASLEGIQKQDKRELELLDELNELKKESEDKQIEILVKGLGSKYDLLDLWLKSTLSEVDENEKKRILSKLFKKIGRKNGPTADFLKACEKNTFIVKFKESYLVYWFKEKGVDALPYVVSHMSGRLIELWIGANINKNTDKKKQGEFLDALYKNIGWKNHDKFFKLCKDNSKNKLFGQLKDGYKLYWIKQGDTALSWILSDPVGRVNELATYIAVNGSTPDQQVKAIEKVFGGIPSDQTEAFINACDKDKELCQLRDAFIQYILQKNNALLCSKDNKGKIVIYLEFGKKDIFDKFYRRGFKVSNDVTFDKAYNDTKDFYAGLKKLGIDETIPLMDIFKFFKYSAEIERSNQNAYKQYKNNLAEANKHYEEAGFAAKYLPGDPQTGGPSAASMQHSVETGMAEESYKRQLFNNCVALEEAYASLLLKSKNPPKGTFPGISGGNLKLDFSKGKNPKNIVRDTFGENLTDAWNKFKYDISHDRKSAAGSVAGIITGIVAAGLSCVEGNVWAAGGAFVVGSRFGNAITQEALNTMQYLVEEHGIVLMPGIPIPVYLPEGLRPEKGTGGNAVRDPGVSFMIGIGAYEPVLDKDGEPILDKSGKVQYQPIGWERFLTELGFDYAGAVAMFGAFKALGPVFESIGSFKLLPETVGKIKLPSLARLPVGKPLEFASKWLFVQNFGIDMPMNALHAGYNAYFGIGDNGIQGSAAGIYENEGGERRYESGNIGEAFRAMGDNIKEHLSFDNQTQVLFNTILYCGALEAGQGFIGKMKRYMPEKRVREYERSSKKFKEEQKKFMGEIEKKGLELKEVDGDFRLVRKGTGEIIPKGDPVFNEIDAHFKEFKLAIAEHSRITSELVASERELNNNRSLTYGLLNRLGLLRNTQPPLKILEGKINDYKKPYEDYKKRYENAQKAGDLKAAQEIKPILDAYEETLNMYLSAQIVLTTEVHPGSIENINLTIVDRIKRAEELLGKELTADQKVAISKACEVGGNPYSLLIDEITYRCRILCKGGFTAEQVKILMDNCICGKTKGAEKGKNILEREESEMGDEGEVRVDEENFEVDGKRFEVDVEGKLVVDGKRVEVDVEGKLVVDGKRVEVDAEGKTTVDGKRFEVDAEGKLVVDGKRVEVDAEGKLIVDGERVEVDADKGLRPDAGKSNKVTIDTAEGIKGGKENAIEDMETIKKHLREELKKLGQEGEEIRKVIETKMDDMKKDLEKDFKKNPEERQMDVDFDPENGTFSSYGGFEKFIEDLISRGKTDKNFLNNIKLTIDYMTKKIINVGGGKKVTLKERKENLGTEFGINGEFMKELERNMINQWLDNPQYFNSHGFDHTVLVHSLIIKVRNGLNLSAEEFAKKYGIKTEELARKYGIEPKDVAENFYEMLIEMSAILHDFGYPKQVRGDKTTHATGGAELFNKELRPHYEKYLKERFELDEKTAEDLICEMYNSICFHGADKVELHYVSRIEGLDNGGRLYGGTLVPHGGAIKGESVDKYMDFQDYRVSYKSEGFKEGKPGRYTGLRNGKIVVFESYNGKSWKIVAEEGKKGKVEDITDVEKQQKVDEKEVKNSVRDWQNASRTIAYIQAIELSKKWGGNIRIYTKEGKNEEFQRIEDKDGNVRFERKVGNKVESVEDFMKGKDILRIEGEKEGENHKIEIEAENKMTLNQQALATAEGWSCDFTIQTDVGEIKYDKVSGKYYERKDQKRGKEISKGELIEVRNIGYIQVEGGKQIKVNYDAYEGRFLNEDGKDGGAGLEYRSRDISANPLASMIRIADNLDMAFNRLIPSQSNAIFITTLYNLENGSQLAKFFQSMEDYNKKVNDKIKDRKKELKVEELSNDEIEKIVNGFSTELLQIRKEGFGRTYGIEFYKIFEEKGKEIDRKDKDPGEQREYRGADGSGFRFDFMDYYNGTTFNLASFKQKLFDHVRYSGQIGTNASKEILDMSYDLMSENKVGSYSVRHMVGLRSVVDVDFDGSVNIEIDMDTHFNSKIAFSQFTEKNKNLRLVEYHLRREGTALDAVPLYGHGIKSYIVDGKGNIIGEIDSNGRVDYSRMFESGVKIKDDGSIDYSKGIIKPEYNKYKDSPLFSESGGPEEA